MRNHRFGFRAMGSVVDVAVVIEQHVSVDQIDDDCRRFVGGLERTWSRFDPSSELVQLNARAGTGPVRASEPLLDAVDAALALWRATDGLFDPTVIGVLEGLGYDRDFALLRNATTIMRDRRCAPGGHTTGVPTPEGVLVDHDRGSVTLPAGVRLDLGGVGKGLAADRLAAYLMTRGAVGACVSLGGDVAVAGEVAGDGWRVPVLDPSHANRVGWQVPLRGGALVQSDRTARAWESDGESRHHIIDPRIAAPACSGVLAVVARAERAWWAEGVSKAALVAGPIEGAALLRRLVTAAWIIRDDGCVVLVGDVGVGKAA